MIINILSQLLVFQICFTQAPVTCTFETILVALHRFFEDQNFIK